MLTKGVYGVSSRLWRNDNSSSVPSAERRRAVTPKEKSATRETRHEKKGLQDTTLPSQSKMSRKLESPSPEILASILNMGYSEDIRLGVRRPRGKQRPKKVFRGGAIEVDFSDFGGLKKRFGTTGPGVMQQLAKDFPRFRTNGVIMYVGNSGRISNIRSIVAALRGAQMDVFCEVTFRDLNYFHQEHISGLPELAFSRIANASSADTPELADALTKVMIDLATRIYRQDQLMY